MTVSSDADAQLQHKLAHLRKIVADMGSALVCFSGGVDSTFLLRVARDVLADRCVGLTTVSAAVPESEVAEARALAERIGARHVVVESREMDRPEFVRNAADRCYHCKTELMSIAKPQADDLQLRWICLGTNVDDLSDHRPGTRAASEQGARHPLVEAGLTKSEIRALSRQLDLPTWDKPQMACLSSRIPYGTAVTVERLSRIDALEQALHALGFRQVRVRHHESVARIEIETQDFARAIENHHAIVQAGRRAGYAYVALDLAGYRTGALNETLRQANG
jgi:pyridinium-3,5-biscarboxylic acid mononucleotide sulfurtransferase